MSEFFDPYNADRPLMLKCNCGRDHSPADHHAEVAADAAAAMPADGDAERAGGDKVAPKN